MVQNSSNNRDHAETCAHIAVLHMPKHVHITWHLCTCPNTPISVLHMPKHVHRSVLYMPKQVLQCTSTIMHVPCHINTSLELFPNQKTSLITHQANTMVNFTMMKHFETQIGGRAVLGGSAIPRQPVARAKQASIVPWPRSKNQFNI